MKRIVCLLLCIALVLTLGVVDAFAQNSASVVYYVTDTSVNTVTGLREGESFSPDYMPENVPDGKYFAGWTDANGNYILKDGIVVSSGENKLYASLKEYVGKENVYLNPQSSIAMPSFDINGENYLNYTDTDNGYAYREFVSENGEEFMRVYNSQGWISRIFMQLSDKDGAAYQLKQNTKYYITVTYKVPKYVRAVDIAVISGINLKDRASLSNAYNGVAQTVGYLSETTDTSLTQGSWTWVWHGNGHSQWAVTAASSEWQTAKFSFTTGDFNGFLPTVSVGINMPEAQNGERSEFLIKNIEIRDENYKEPATVNYYIGDTLDCSLKVESTGAAYSPSRMPSKIPDGKYFAGWADKDGVIVSGISLESGKADLYAVFKDYQNSLVMDMSNTYTNGSTINYPSFVANDIKGEFSATVDRAGWSYRGFGENGVSFYSTASWGMSGGFLVNDKEGNAFVAQENSSYKITVEYKVEDIVTKEEVAAYPDGSTYIGGYVTVGVGIGIEPTQRRDLADKKFLLSSVEKTYKETTDWITESYVIETKDLSGYLPVVGVSVTSIGVPVKVGADGKLSHSDPADISYGLNKVVVRKITVEKNPTAVFADKDGNVITTKSYVSGEKIDFSAIAPCFKDIIFENGTGYTVKEAVWYSDKALQTKVDIDNTVVNSGEYTFYADITPVTAKKYGQVSFYGFEDRNGAPEGYIWSEGYYSNKAVTSTSLSKYINIAPNVLLDDDTVYSLNFFYKGQGILDINGKSVTLSEAEEYTLFTTDVYSLDRKLVLAVVDGNVTLDSISVNEVIKLSGASVLTDDAQSIEDAQAIRVYASHFNDEAVIERGFIVYGGKVDGQLTEKTNKAITTSKTVKFDECWEKTDTLLTFSNYIKDLEIADKRIITVRAYVKTNDGNKYYSKQLSYSVDNIKISNELVNYRTEYSFGDNSVLEKIKVQGAYEKLPSGITLDWTAATVVVNAYCVGEVNFKLHIPANIKDHTYTVLVDGNRLAGYYEPKADDLSMQIYSVSIDVGNIPAVHTIELARRAEAYHGISEVLSVTLNGELVKAENNNTLIEFIGDSITCGMGNIDNSGTALGNDGTQTYAFFASRKAGVDYRMRSRSGSGFNYSSGGEIGAKYSWDTNYKIQSAWRSVDNPYVCEREADVVCIYLGTNDLNGWLKVTGNTLQEDADKVVAEMKELISIVKSYNKNAKIVWISGGITAEYANLSERTIAELGGEENGYYTVTLPKGDSGGGGHPTVAEQIKMGEALYEFLIEKNLV